MLLFVYLLVKLCELNGLKIGSGYFVCILENFEKFKCLFMNG